jgi:hypothetical protein
VRSAARGSPFDRPRSASTTPTSVISWEIVPLGHQLRTDHDIRLALGDRLELDPKPPRAAGHVRRQHDHARIGEMLVGLFRDPLDPRPAGHQMVKRPAGRAGLRHRLVVAAMVALQLRAEPVLDQPARAVRTLEPVAADPAQCQRRIAAPVEKQQRLLLALQRLGYAFQQQRRQEPAARRRHAPEVDQLDIRQPGIRIAPRQHQMAVAPLRALTRLSIDGVADASTPESPLSRARTTAMSRAL